MNFEIDNPCEVYETYWHVARKPHRCQGCSFLIPAGAQYQRHHMVGDGTASDEACCFACAIGLRILTNRHGTHPSPGYAVDFLRECVDGERGDRLAKISSREERGVLAGMLRRNRAACRERSAK